MKTISAVVEHYIKKKPFLQTALAQGIINLTSLSRQIKPEIAEELGKDVKDGAIVMALKRLSDDLEFRATHKIVKYWRNHRAFQPDGLHLFSFGYHFATTGSAVGGG